MTLNELLSNLKDGLVIKVSIPKDSYEMMTIRSQNNFSKTVKIFLTFGN